MGGLNAWGKHLILNASGANLEKISSAENIANFARELVKRIDMVAYGEPQTPRFGSGDKFGITLVQLIETSNIVAHFVEENNSLYLDVFSCKDFDENVVVETVIEFFSVTNVTKMVMMRDAFMPMSITL